MSRIAIILGLTLSSNTGIQGEFIAGMISIHSVTRTHNIQDSMEIIPRDTVSHLTARIPVNICRKSSDFRDLYKDHNRVHS